MTLLAPEGLTEITEGDLTLAASAKMLRATKDKSYRATPLGLEVARYYRWKKNEDGAATETLRDYESILAKTSLFFADLDLPDFIPPAGTDLLRECWDHHWGERSERTRAKVRSVWVDFFDWAVDNRAHPGNPARRLRVPRQHDTKKDIFTDSFVSRVIVHQDYLADKLGCILILLYALRRAELAGVRFRDFDFERRQLTVTGKGQRVRLIPIVEEAFWRDLGALQLELQAPPDWALLYRTSKSGMRVFRYHNRCITPRSVHTWWYRCLKRAGLVEGDKDEGGWTGQNMHRGRHTVATDILRKTGNIVAAQNLLGHKNVETTVRAYAHFDTADMERVLRGMREEPVEPIDLTAFSPEVVEAAKELGLDY